MSKKIISKTERKVNSVSVKFPEIEPNKFGPYSVKLTMPKEKKSYIPLETRISEFELAYLSGEDYAKQLDDLARAVVSIVLHTVRDPQRKTGEDKFKKIGDKNVKTLNGYYNKTFDAMLSQINASANYNTTVSDVEDLVMAAIVSILEEAQEHLKNMGDMEKAYTELKQSKKVIIDGENVELKAVDVSPIQKAHRAVRKTIDDEKSVKFDPANGYLYFSDVIQLDDNGEEKDVEIYVRGKKYYDLGSYETDFNGKLTVYTPDGDGKEEAETIESMIEKLKLSPGEETIVRYRLRGYGKHTISRKMNIKEDTYKRYFKRIRAKAEKTFPDMCKF